MKNFFKKVAFVLALAMVLSNIGPAAKASAAEAPGLKYTSRVIYVGGSAFDDYTDNCWTPSKNTEGYKVTYEVTAGNNLIDVAKNGKITATGNGIGKAVVKVTYTPEDGGKETSANFTVKVRRNATDVRLTNATIALVEEALNIGDEIELNAAKSFVGNSYKTGNYGLNNYVKLVSDQIAYATSNDEVIKVEGNKLTAVGNGTATLTVYTYEYLDKTQTPVIYKDYEITVIGGLLSVVQKTTSKIEVALGNAEGVKASDFTITRVASNMNIAVKDIAVDGNVVAITTFAEMKDGAEYSVQYDGKEIIFTATDNKVEEITINRQTVEANTETEISVNLVDVKGVILDTVKNTSGRANVSFSIETNEGYVLGDKLVLFETGNTAKVSVTYRTGQYDSETGAEIGTISREFAIVAVDPSPIVPGTMKYALQSGEPNWDDLTSNATICVGETNNLHLYKKDSKDTDLTKTAGYTYESSNNDVLIVNGTDEGSNGKGVRVSVTAVKAGTAFVLVKKDSVVVDTIMITIRAARVFNTFTLDNTVLTLSNSINIGTDGIKTAKVQFKDQYGDNMTTSGYVIEKVSGPSVDPIIADDNRTGTITFAPSGKDAGTYQFKVSKDNVVRVITVVVQAPGSGTSYKLIIDGDKTDVAYNSDDDNYDTEVVVKVGIYNGGVLDGYVDMTAGTIKKGGTEVSTVSGSDIMTLAARTISGGIVDKAAAGTYVVNVTIHPVAADINLAGAFTINDSQKAMSVKLEKITGITATDPEGMVKEAMDFYYDGGKVDEANITVIEVKSPNAGDWAAGESKTYNATVAISSIKVLYQIGSNKVELSISVNRTIAH